MVMHMQALPLLSYDVNMKYHTRGRAWLEASVNLRLRNVDMVLVVRVDGDEVGLA